MNTIRIAIIGTGAVGTTIACTLAQHNLAAEILAREDDQFLIFIFQSANLESKHRFVA